MKGNRILVFIVFTGLLFSCNTKSKKEHEAMKAEIAALTKQNAQLAQGKINMIQSIDHYNSMLKQIDSLVTVIDAKQVLIKEKSIEFKDDASVEQDILIHLDHLHQLMENAKHKINHLNNNLNELRKKNADQYEEIYKLDLYINDLADIIIKKDSEVVVLNEALMADGLEIDALSQAYNNQASYNEVLLDIINTAFFVSGTRKELKELGIVDMEGGFIGLGRVKTLNANAPIQFLVPIDIRTTNMLELVGINATLLTPHAPESFEITTDKQANLIIISIENKLKFWQETNYLIVEISN
jgi:hypothetical protein